MKLQKNSVLCLSAQWALEQDYKFSMVSAQ